VIEIAGFSRKYICSDLGPYTRLVHVGFKRKKKKEKSDKEKLAHYRSGVIGTPT
jgi:hypothetical protein